MKQILWKGIRLIAFVILMFVIVSGVYRVFSWKDTTGGYLSSLSQLYDTPKNQMDVVFVGSSHCYCSIYPAYMWRDAGISAFDMAVSGQDKASAYHMLGEVLKTQKPKVVCVEMYGLLTDKLAVEGNLYRNMLSMKTSKNSIDLVKTDVEEEKQKDFMLKWPIIHTRYRELDKYDFVQYPQSTYGRGALFQWNAVEYEVGLSGADTDEVGELSAENKKWLQDLYELAQENSFELIFFVAPFQIDYNQQKIINAAASFASEKGIEFFDFNKLRNVVELDAKADFYDPNHCNALGAEKLTGFFTEYLTDVYQLPNHRGDESYEAWKLDYVWYLHSREAARLKNISDAGEYMDTVCSLDGVVTVVSLEAGFENNGEFFFGLMERLGIPLEEYTTGGKWIYSEGQAMKVLENDPDAEAYIMELNKEDTLRVQYVEDLYPGNVMINWEEYSQKFYCLTVVTYDTFTGEVIESRGF